MPRIETSSWEFFFQVISSLTWVGLQEHFCLSQDLLGPVLGPVGPSDQVVQVRIQLCLLSLAQFLLCELEREKSQEEVKNV